MHEMKLVQPSFGLLIRSSPFTIVNALERIRQKQGRLRVLIMRANMYQAKAETPRPPKLYSVYNMVFKIQLHVHAVEN